MNLNSFHNQSFSDKSFINPIFTSINSLNHVDNSDINSSNFTSDINLALDSELPLKSSKNKKYFISLSESRLLSKNLNLNLHYKNKKFITLNNIQSKSFYNPLHQFDDLMNILTDHDFLFHCLGSISKNKGILTPGVDSTTIDGSSLQTIYDISNSLKSNSYRFKPVKRIFIPKSTSHKQDDTLIRNLFYQGKLTPDKIKELKIRPLGICSFPDKIVQEGIRLILHCIYEPEFLK